MIVDFRRYLPRFISESAPLLLTLTALSLFVDRVHVATKFATSLMTLGGVGLVTTAVSVFVSFRMGEAYERWWEARKLWGRLINASRTFGRQVTTLMDCGTEAHRELVLRHVAYVKALRSALLHSPRGERQDLWEELKDLLPAEDREELRGYANVPTYLAMRQAQRLRELSPDSVEGRLTLLRLDETLEEFCTIQGACERIRNTVFPVKVTVLTRCLVWGLALFMPWAVFEVNYDHHWLEIAAVVFFSFSFIKLERVGSELKNPFDGGSNSMPMKSMARVVEVDLRQMLGEAALPPVAPVRGVLH